MKKSVKYWSVMFFLLISFAPFIAPKVEAFSLSTNPFMLFSNLADTLTERVSDLVYYLVMQKKYIFDNFSDPNKSIDQITPTNFDKMVNNIAGALTSTTTARLPKVMTPRLNLGSPIIVNPPVLPSLKPTSIGSPIPIVGQTASSAPGLVVDTKGIVKPVSIVASQSNILIYTNEERVAKSLEPLSANASLDNIARLRVDDLFKNQYFEHSSPDGQSVTDLATTVGYDYILIGENLAMGNFDGDQGIVSAWMDSSGHRANILNGKYQELGVAERQDTFNGQMVTIAVQIFGEPSAVCTKPKSSTKSLITSSTVSISEMQAQAKIMYDSLNNVKADPTIDQSYYNQKVQEYNYFAKTINDAVLDLKNMVDLYNSQVNQYNSCIGS